MAIFFSDLRFGKGFGGYIFVQFTWLDGGFGDGRLSIRVVATRREWVSCWWWSGLVEIRCWRWSFWVMVSFCDFFLVVQVSLCITLIYLYGLVGWESNCTGGYWWMVVCFIREKMVEERWRLKRVERTLVVAKKRIWRLSENCRLWDVIILTFRC